jgi:hypothetical protein
MARGTPDVRPKIRCSCGEALVWSARPFCWVCPKVVKTMIEGLLEPGREKFNSPETTALIAEGHITCLPHEMVADDVQPDPGAFVNRAGGKLSALNGKVEKPTHFEDGTRVIYDDRGVALPRHHQSYQTIATWQCNDCGYRTPSAQRHHQGVGRDVKTARQWLETADFDHIHNPQMRLQFVKMVGADKADEVQAAMSRIAENLLDSLGAMRMREETLMRLMRAVSAIAVDNYLGLYREDVTGATGHGIALGPVGENQWQAKCVCGWQSVVEDVEGDALDAGKRHLDSLGEPPTGPPGERGPGWVDE